MRIYKINADTIKEAAETLKSRNDRSAWKRGINAYALELLDTLHEDLAYENRNHRIDYQAGVDMTYKQIAAALLRGADSWYQYSEGGCALIYDCDIAERLCTPSELRRTHHGDRNPNGRETWLDVQARALSQAANRTFRALASAASITIIPD